MELWPAATALCGITLMMEMELLTDAFFYIIQPTWLSAWLDFIELDFYFVCCTIWGR